MSHDESNAYAQTRKEERTSEIETAAIEAWISGQLMTPLESFYLYSTSEEADRLDVLLGHVLTHHVLRSPPDVMRSQVASLLALLRAPLVRSCNIEPNRKRRIQEWIDSQ